MAKLKWLKIEQFRNIEPGTELVFHDGFNILLGHNGTGKTTLLKLISMALSSCFAGLENDAFAFAYEIETPSGSARVRVRNQPRERDFADIARSRAAPFQEGSEWSYQASIVSNEPKQQFDIEANATGAGGRFSETAETILLSVVSPFRESFLSWCLGAKPGLLILGAVLSEASPPFRHQRFDEALGIFSLITGGENAGDDPTDGVRLLIGLPNPSIAHLGMEYTLFPIRAPRFLAEKFQAEKPGIGSDRITLDHKDLPFLAQTVELCGFEKGELLMTLESSGQKGNFHQLVYGKFTFLFTLDNGSKISHEALSYGQKRLLSFLYHLDLNEDIVIADELVNGLHYDWIEACVEAMGDRQAFLTSQNPILLDFLSFESVQDVSRSFLLCRRERREGGSKMVWKNLDAESSEAFYRSYRTRALQVSEILRTKGLW